MPIRTDANDLVQFDHPDTAGNPGLLQKLEFIDKSGNVVATLQKTVAGVVTIQLAGGSTLGSLADAVTALTDSSGGISASSLVAVGVTNTGDRAAQINANFASLNTEIEALKASLVAAGLLHA